MFRAHASAEDPGPSSLPGEELPPEPSPERTPRGPKAESRRVADAARVSARRERVASLLLQRLSEAEIARALTVNRSTICKDVRAIQAEWSRTRVGDYHTLVVRELRALDLDESRLRARLERYVWPAGADIDHGIEGLRLRVLDRIMKIGERRARILGLDSPTRLELAGRDGGPIEVTGGEIGRRVAEDPHASDLAALLVERIAALGPAAFGSVIGDPAWPDGDGGGKSGGPSAGDVEEEMVPGEDARLPESPAA